MYMLKVKNDIVFFEQESVHIRYIRKGNKRVGAMVAFEIEIDNNSRVVFGWSLCHKKDMKHFNSREAVERAMERAVAWDMCIRKSFIKENDFSGGLVTTEETRVPVSIRKDFIKFIEKKMKYFKYINNFSKWIDYFLFYTKGKTNEV